MGLLAVGTPYPWIESRQYNDLVQARGIQYIQKVYQSAKNRDNDVLYWGDELEYMLVSFDDSLKTAQLDLENDNLVDLLNQSITMEQDKNIHFHPEYGRFMLEATPERPYLQYDGDEKIELNMQTRRKYAEQYLNDKYITKNIKPLTVTSFPILGAKNFTTTSDEVLWDHKNEASRSLFLPDEVINKHIRFPTLTANIRSRRGEKVAMQIPMFQDTNTPTLDDSIDYNRSWYEREDSEAAKLIEPKMIYLDAMGFGMGCCCLQMTYQAPNLNKARYLYDSLANFAPILLSLSAAAPFFKGFLADQDVRWNVISGGTDDRTPKERNVQPLLPKHNINGYGGISEEKQGNVQSLPKARYSKVDLFLGGTNYFDKSYNDTDVPINNDVLNKLHDSNDGSSMDYNLAKHFAHLYVRDPLVIFSETLTDPSDDALQNHFENIQSTNWQTLRFKPPTPSATPDNKDVPGWRVEFRPLEVQLTDFENAAYSVFVYLIVEFLLNSPQQEELDPYMSMSKIWENMDIAHMRDSVITKKFHWKSDFNHSTNTNGKTELMSIGDIFHNSKSGIFPVFINSALKLKKYIQNDWKELKDSTHHQRLYYYLKMISDRASGKIPSTARYLRDFLMKHPDYKKDSKITESMNYDVLQLCDRISHYEDSEHELSLYFGKELSDYLQSNKL